MPYSSIIFNEGEPLDPNKLNQLQTNLAEIYKTSNSLYNATVNDQGSASVPLVYFGRVTTGSLTANRAVTVTLPFPSTFNIDQETFVIASVAQSVGNDIISVSARKDASQYVAFVVSNTTRSGVALSYLMVQQKTI